MSQQYRLARGGRAGGSRRMDYQDNENKQKFNNLRRNHQLDNMNLKIIGNSNNRPVKILTARKIKQEAQTGRAAKIQQNLEHMQLAAQKKRYAQEHYYGQGKSPLARKQGLKQQPLLNNQKMSVQQRLGQNNVASFNKTKNNQNNFNNKKQFNTNTTKNNNFNIKKQFNNKPVNDNFHVKKQFTPNYKQQKLNRIQTYNINQNRFQNKKTNIQPQRFNNAPNKFNNTQRGNNIKTVNPLTGEVKFLRPLRKKQTRPQNYTISVQNGTQKIIKSEKHHVTSELNPVIQQEIKIIQNKSATLHSQQGFVAQVSSIIPETRVPIMATRTTLNERFSRI